MDLTSSLHRCFGFTSFRAGQAEAIQSILTGHHTLVVMPTGAGKSLVFQLAALQLEGLTLVISPLIALMKDQVDSLTRRNIPATYINSALPLTEQNLRFQNITQNKYRMVYVAPERLRNVSFINALRSQRVSLLAVDEAHCISEWGHDFRPDYLHIARARAQLGNPLTVALTATATPQVQKDIVRLLGLGDSTCIVTGFNRPNLALDVKYVSGLPAKLRALSELLSPCKSDCQHRTCGPVHTCPGVRCQGVSDLPSGAAIIYTGTRRDAEEVTEFAREVLKIPAEFYHAGLLPGERTRIQNDFIARKLDMICATNAFGMGIDRANVRQVIHYSMPGSLESYYQEAGRAGRDGQPSRATLLYDPEDRALQEFFISSSALTEGDLRAVYRAIRSGEQAWLTTDELSRLTELHPVQVRVGLSMLERAGTLEHLGDEGFRMLFRKATWNQQEIERAILHGKEHMRHRQTQLDGIVHYAESNSCRRRIILDHFGDAEEAEAADCCDNCQGAEPVQRSENEPDKMSHGERAALVILDCVRRSHVRVGREKLAQILHGSKAKDILQFHHDRNVYYGKLAIVKQSDIEVMIGQLTELGYLKVIGGQYPVLHLTPRGENSLKQKEAIPLKAPKYLNATEIQRAKAKLEAGGTVEYTARLLVEGLKPEEIAHERGLAVTTIYGHCAQLIERGVLEISRVIPCEIQMQIEEAIRKAGSTQYLSPIKALLPNEVDFNMIRCVVAARQACQSDCQTEPQIEPDTSPGDCLETAHSKISSSTISIERVVELGETKPPGAVSELIQALESENANVRRLAASALGKIRDRKAVEPLLKLLRCENKPQVRQYAVKALGAIGDKRAEKFLKELLENEDEMFYTRDSARTALEKLYRTTHPSAIVEQTDGETPKTEYDGIEAFLAKPHPRPLVGSWQTGWSLGFHSRFAGRDWARSGVGDLTYRLKYESDQTVLPALIRQTLEVFQAHAEMGQADLILPVPCSSERKLNPVHVFCEALAGTIRKPMQTILTRTRQTQPQKEMKTLAQKHANVAGAFALCGEVQAKRILLVDDLFDSGATLEEITQLLFKHGAARVNVLTLTRTIHADA